METTGSQFLNSVFTFNHECTQCFCTEINLDNVHECMERTSGSLALQFPFIPLTTGLFTELAA